MGHLRYGRKAFFATLMNCEVIEAMEGDDVLSEIWQYHVMNRLDNHNTKQKSRSNKALGNLLPDKLDRMDRINRMTRSCPRPIHPMNPVILSFFFVAFVYISGNGPLFQTRSGQFASR